MQKQKAIKFLTEEVITIMERVKLADLHRKLCKPVIRGIIIQSQNIQIYEKYADYDASWTFTIRDSPDDTVNVKFWGDRINVEKLHKQFHIGDVVDIRSPTIYMRQFGHETERYVPTTTSNYFLLCQIKTAKILPCTEEESEEYAYLIYIPCKDVKSCMLLDNITTVSNLIDGSYVNLLGVVLAVSRKQIYYKCTMTEPRFLNTLTVTDQSLVEHKIKLWDDENIRRSSKWIPRKTILFITEARVHYSKTEDRNEIFFVKKTVVTENPSIPQTQLLQDYFSIPDDNYTFSLDLLTSNQPDTTDDVLALPAESRMTDDVTLQAGRPDAPVVMSVQEILANTVVIPSPGLYARPKPFTTTLHCFILDKHLDRYADILTFTCNECKEIASQYGCYDCCCSLGNPSQPSIVHPHFRCNIQLADQTGSLHCRMTGQIATDILGQTPQEYLTRTEEEYNHLKRFFIHNQFEMKVLVTPVVSAPPHIRIISLTKL